MDRDKPQCRCCIWFSIAVLVILYIVIRSLNLNLFVTTDEPFWLGRSANFYRALAQDDLAHTYQMAHPGVLTMWAGSLAYARYFPHYVRDITANISVVYGIDGILRQLGEDPLALLIAARVMKILLQTVFFAISLRLIRSLFGLPVMIVAGGLIVFDPFLSGLDSLLHVDGLFAITSFAAILALAAVVQAKRDAILPWLLAGVLAACAWMTRATGVALIAIVGCVGIAQALRIKVAGPHRSLRASLELPAFSVLLWMVGAGIASVLLLPALWVDPFGTMQQVWDWSRNAATEGHERPTFFLGRITTGDPGWLFYPVTLVWRLTPVGILGVLAFVVMFPVAKRRAWLTVSHIRSLAILVGFALLYTVAMTTGAKKFDRYISPVYPIVDLAAAIGVVFVARWLVETRPDWRRLALPATAGVVLLAQAGFLASSLPYRLDFYNPMLGGLAHAQDAVQVGWGEGGGEAMAFIVDDADGRDVIVQKSSPAPVLSYFAPPNIRFDGFGLGTPAGWYETDYFVVGIQEWQRDLSPSYHMMQQYEPVDVVRISGVPFFETYTPKRLSLPESLRGETACSAIFGAGLELMQIIGRDGTVDLYWLTVGEVPADVEILVTFTAPDGEPGIARSAVFQPAGDGRMSRATVDDPRGEDDPALSDYELAIVVSNPATGHRLSGTFNGAAIDDGVFLTHSECYGAS